MTVANPLVEAPASTTDLDPFVLEACHFLDAHAPRRDPLASAANTRLTLFPERTADEQRAELAEARRWRQTAFDAGFGWVDGPPRYGGRGLSRAHAAAYRALEREYATPPLGIFGITDGMVVPTVLAHGSDIAKDAFVRALRRGDAVGCQLFSEPEAGSDLASVATSAQLAGESWIVRGQKVWTSHAQVADVGLLLARTDHRSKHRGLTMFLIDMHAPGVDVRPLRQMTGGCSFNEVFLTDVAVQDAMRLGPVDGGWRAAITTLMHERAFVGEAQRFPHLKALTDLIRCLGAGTDPNVRQEFAAIYTADLLALLSAGRAVAAEQRTGLPGPERSIGKLALTANLQRAARLAGRLLGPRVLADDGSDTFSWAGFLLSVPGVRLAGGTDEIQRNIIAERVLGLPKDPGHQLPRQTDRTP